MRGLFFSCFLVILILTLVGPARAHQDEAPFSWAIIEPLEIHHAHIEDEQKLNFGFPQGLRDGGPGADAALEAAWHWDFRYGVEAFVPVSIRNVPTDTGNVQRLGLGDVTLFPFKYALVNEPNQILSAILITQLPTGSVEQGLGEGRTGLGSALFLDRTWGNLFVGANLEYLRFVSSGGGDEWEGGIALAYSFIEPNAEEHVDEDGQRIARAGPGQGFIVAPSLELLFERERFAGETETATAVLPGLQLWDVESGWQLGLGVKLPTGGHREADAVYLLQFRNHFDW